MREIKFRVWLPHARRSSWSGNNPPDRRKFGRMLYFDELYFSISDDSLQHPQIFTDTPEHFYGEDISVTQKDAILLQYTGLHDNDDVEIYEGDIVKAKDCSYNHGDDWTGEMRMGNFNGAWCLYRTVDVSAAQDGSASQEKGIPILNFINFMAGIVPEFELEVIGNIYENKELMK